MVVLKLTLKKQRVKVWVQWRVFCEYSNVP